MLLELDHALELLRRGELTVAEYAEARRLDLPPRLRAFMLEEELLRSASSGAWATCLPDGRRFTDGRRPPPIVEDPLPTPMQRTIVVDVAGRAMICPPGYRPRASSPPSSSAASRSCAMDRRTSLLISRT